MTAAKTISPGSTMPWDSNKKVCPGEGEVRRSGVFATDKAALDVTKAGSSRYLSGAFLPIQSATGIAKMGTQAMALEFVTILCLEDNYAYLVHDAESSQTALVDAPEAGPILEALKTRDWQLSEIWLTHHHSDHIDVAPNFYPS